MTQPDQPVFLRNTSGFKQFFSNAFLGLLGFLIVGNAAWAQSTAGQTTNPQNLTTLYSLAKQNDPTFKAAAAQLQADLETENQAFSALLPNSGVAIAQSETGEAASGGQAGGAGGGSGGASAGAGAGSGASAGAGAAGAGAAAGGLGVAGAVGVAAALGTVIAVSNDDNNAPVSVSQSQ